MTSHFWKSEDNLNLYAQVWKATNPRGKICLVHGMGEHIGRYPHVAQFYNSKGFSVYGYDQRGHGKSEGKRGHSPSFQHLLNDLKSYISTVNETDPHLPTILYGHSMGGNLVLNFTLLHPEFQAATIATSPWIELAFKPPKLLMIFAKLIRNIMPSFAQDTKLNASAISKDKNVVTKYKSDPLVHSSITTAMAVDLMDAGNTLLNYKNDIKKPILLMHGTEDQLTSHQSSVEFSKKHSEITFKSWPGMYHETHNEPDKEKVFNYALDWLENIMKQL